MSTHLVRGGEQATAEAEAAPEAPKDRPVAPVELIATVALALSTLIAVTVVSIGIARADVFGVAADAEHAPLAIALFIGLLLSGMGGLTAIMADDRNTPRD